MAESNLGTKNILLVIPSLGIGGAEKSLANLSIELARRYNVYVCIFNEEIPIAFPFGGELLSLNISGASSIPGKITSFYRRVIALRTLKKKYAIDVCISFLEGADFINILSKRREKVIVSIRSSKVHYELGAARFSYLRSKLLIPGLYNRADKVVIVQKSIQEEVIEHLSIRRERTCVIGNFFDVARIRALAQESTPLDRIFEAHPILAACGRLVKIKGFDQLLLVFCGLVKQDESLKLLIIGDGPNKEELIGQARSLGLSVWFKGEEPEAALDAKVFFVGNQENPYKYIAKARVFLQTSHSESFANTIAEAMILGLPVISTDCPYGPREMLAPATTFRQYGLSIAEYAEYGVLMPQWQADNRENIVNAWVTTLRKMLNNSELYMEFVQRAETRAQDYAKEKIVCKWLALIESNA